MFNKVYGCHRNPFVLHANAKKIDKAISQYKPNLLFFTTSALLNFVKDNRSPKVF